MSESKLKTHRFSARVLGSRGLNGRRAVKTIHSQNCLYCGIDMKFAGRVKCPAKKGSAE